MPHGLGDALPTLTLNTTSPFSSDVVPSLRPLASTGCAREDARPGRTPEARGPSRGGRSSTRRRESLTQAESGDGRAEVAKCIEAVSRPIHYVGVGNPLRGDDGVGVQLALLLRQALRGRGVRRVKVHGPTSSPERTLSSVPRSEGLVIFDAIEARVEPGRILCASLGSTEFGFFATHNVPLRIIPGVSERKDGVFVIGIEPESLDVREGLSVRARESAEALVGELVRLVSASNG